ncbi:MAG: BadF/BadG/BcrA/BcrD ATPase family protein [Acidobacteriaceae bacterium]
MDYFLGIDAGATKTNCVLGTQNEVLARAHGGSIKITSVPEADAEEHLQDVLSSLVRQSGIALSSIAGTCVGLSGFAIPSVSGWVRKAFASRLGGPVALCGDEVIALDAAFHGGRGILAIAGTGSHVVGRTRDGQLVRTGGWGPVMSDQGAGSRIGLLALRAMFHALDASEETTLLPAVHAAWKTQTVEELIERGNRVPVVEFSQLAPLVAQCAAEGDAVARGVLWQSGEELADLVLLAMRKGNALESRASADPSQGEPWTVAYTGSVVEKISLLRESMFTAIHRLGPAVQFLSQPADPPIGALWRAAHASTPK